MILHFRTEIIARWFVNFSSLPWLRSLGVVSQHAAPLIMVSDTVLSATSILNDESRPGCCPASPHCQNGCEWSTPTPTKATYHCVGRCWGSSPPKYGAHRRRSGVGTSGDMEMANWPWHLSHCVPCVPCVMAGVLAWVVTLGGAWSCSVA
jgi:hypothetical protein